MTRESEGMKSEDNFDKEVMEGGGRWALKRKFGLTFGVDTFGPPLFCQDPAASEIWRSLAVVPLEIVTLSVVGS